MGTPRSRLLALLLSVVMVVALLPLPALASGGRSADGRPSRTKPQKTPSLDTKATARGIHVRLDNAPRDMKTFDVYRSTDEGRARRQAQR